MRHIALITTSYPENTPGAEAAGSFVEDFAKELSQRVRVTVLAASTSDTVFEGENLCVRRFAVPRLPLSLLNPVVPTHWLSIWKSIRAGERALEQLVQADKPDHILALWALPGGYWADQIATRYGLAYSIWALGSDIWGLGKLPVVNRILRKVLRRAECRYADGLQLANDVEALCGLPCDFLASTRRLPSGSRNDRNRTAPYRLAFLGRWHRNKGIDLLLDALGHLSDQDWSRISEIRINGGGPLQDLVREEVSKLNARNRPVSVGGYLDKKAAAELITWADYLILPSRIESIPVIFSDAMQLGTPIIATPVGDLPRLHTKYRYGIVAATATSGALAEALHSALTLDASEFDAGLKAASEDFNLARIVDQFVQGIAV